MSTNIASEIVHFAGHTAHPPASRRRLDRPGVSIVRACVSVRGVVCLASGTACPAARAVQSVRVRWGWGLHRRGIWGTPGVGQVSPVTTEKIKKAQKITPPPIANLKNFPQKQKDLYKGSMFCAILALQALKGRNLQWLKVK